MNELPDSLDEMTAALISKFADGMSELLKLTHWSIGGEPIPPELRPNLMEKEREQIDAVVMRCLDEMPEEASVDIWVLALVLAIMEHCEPRFRKAYNAAVMRELKQDKNDA